MAVGLYSGVSGLAVGVGLYKGVSGLWGGSSGLINGFGGSGPFPGASLYLDFLTPPLDSRITFSRGTNATLVDSTGKITYAPANMITNSVGPTSSTGVTASTATGAAPDGTNAVRLTKTDATSPRYAGWNAPFTAQSNTRYVASAYFKYDGYDTTVSLEYNNVVHWGGTAWVAPFNVTASGITADVPNSCTSGVQAIGNGWFRVWAAFTTGTVSSAVTSILTRITGASGVTVLTAWGQIEPVTYQTTPSTYVATTASAYYGPRFDYDPVTLAPRGLLIEEARTNLVTYSDDFGNAAWVKVATTVATNVTPSPDGTASADRLVSTAATAQQWMDAPAASVTTGVSYAFSVYVKASEYTLVQLRFNNAVFSGAEYATFNLANGTITQSTGSGHTITNAGNGWYRCTVIGVATATTTTGPAINLVTNPTGGRNPTITGNGTSGIYIWGAQLEQAAFATSYIPTVASTVSRSADIAQMTGTNFSTWYNQSEGTFISDASSSIVDTTTRSVLTVYASGTPANNIRLLNTLQRQFSVNNSGAQADLDAGDPASNVPNKIGAAYNTNDFALSLNGGTVATDTLGTVPTVNTLGLGANEFDASKLNGHLRAVAYYNTRLPNTQLQTLTAPSLASPLALDFISPTYTVGY